MYIIHYGLSIAEPALFKQFTFHVKLLFLIHKLTVTYTTRKYRMSLLTFGAAAQSSKLTAKGL